MLPEVGGLELLVIAAVALIVVGPKDLPVMLRKLGQFTAKLRGMANEFRASFDEMARQSELDDLRKEVEAMRRGQFAESAAMDASKAQVDQVFHEIGASLEGSGVNFSPAMASTPEPVEIAQVAEAPKASKPRARKAPGAKAAAAKPPAKPKTAKAKTASKGAKAGAKV